MGIQHYRITVSEIVEVQDEAALIEEFRRFRSENFYPPDAEAFHAETEECVARRDVRAIIEQLAEIAIRPGWSPLETAVEVEALPEHDAGGEVLSDEGRTSH